MEAVTAAVHAAGGHIFAQLWHMGRLVHPSVGGAQPVSASETTAPGDAHTYEGKQLHVAARALRVDEIPALLEDYRRAARNALAADFDGVQIHAANGYLIDQFLRDGTNLRRDEYGGSIDNRVRLLREVTTAVIEVAGRDRTAVRLSPNGEVQGVNDSRPHETFPAAARALAELGVVFLELREPPPDSNFGKADTSPSRRTSARCFRGCWY
jgi:2,4-dienoyl-CoA reductase-like NADH-dependent reductase (Old Yellow Enzyme family)